MARTVAERDDLLPALGEVFRTFGYEGATLSAIERATGLGKGSLYHFFPGGKEQMARAVLDDIAAWFEANVFAPLEQGRDARLAIEEMFEAVDSYFRAGRRVCLVGALGLADARDRFAQEIARYFARWASALAAALRRLGHPRKAALAEAHDAIVAIQGPLVLARSLDQPALFGDTLARTRMRLLDGTAQSAR